MWSANLTTSCGWLHEMRGKDEGEGRLAGKEVNENYVCGPEFCFIWFCFI